MVEAPQTTHPGLAPARGAHLAVPPTEDHGEGPVSHEVPLAVLEVAHHLHGRAPRAYSGLAGSTARRPGSAPSARRSGGPPRAARLGQPRPRPRADAHAEWTERKRERLPRGAGVKRGLARPWLLMARPAAGRGLAGEQPRSCRASGAVAVTVRPWSSPRARERCGARSSPSPARLAALALSSWAPLRRRPPP